MGAKSHGGGSGTGQSAQLAITVTANKFLLGLIQVKKGALHDEFKVKGDYIVNVLPEVELK